MHKYFDFNKLKYLNISFESNKEFYAFITYTFPNLESFISEFSITEEDSFIQILKFFQN